MLTQATGQVFRKGGAENRQLMVVGMLDRLGVGKGEEPRDWADFDVGKQKHA